jgi:hypothetical protein
MAGVFKADLRGIEQVRRNINAVRAGFPEWLAAANEQTAEEIANLARRNIKSIDAYATGAMYAGIQVSSSPGGLVFTVGCTEKYAPYVEMGTRPHFPPLDAIREWCRVRGIPESAAFPIARQIARRGLPERPFLFPAMYVGMRNHVNRVRNFVQGGLRKLLA